MHNGNIVFHQPITSLNNDNFSVCLPIVLNKSDFQVLNIRIGSFFNEMLSYESKALRKNIVVIDVNMVERDELFQSCALSTTMRLIRKDRFKW